MSEEDFLSKIRSDLDRGDAAMSQLRLDMDADMKLYRSQKKNAKKEKIGDYTVFSTHSALMAMSYINQPESSFSTDSVSIDEMAKVNNLNAAYKDDFNRTDMEIVKYWQDFWKFMTGVSITARTGWDGENKSNKFEAVDTRYWIPDPDGDYLTGEYSYNGFYKNMYESKLRDMGIWNDDLNKHDTNSMTFDPEKSDKT